MDSKIIITRRAEVSNGCYPVSSDTYHLNTYILTYCTFSTLQDLQTFDPDHIQVYENKPRRICVGYFHQNHGHLLILKILALQSESTPTGLIVSVILLMCIYHSPHIYAI